MQRALILLTFVLTVLPPWANAINESQFTQVKHTSPAFKDVIDLSQQQGHVTELRLPGLAENIQVLLSNLTGRMESKCLDCRDDLSKSLKKWDIAQAVMQSCCLSVGKHKAEEENDIYLWKSC